jgi:molybdate transport system substrate-binding protein
MAALAALLLASSGTSVNAAEIKVLSPIVLETTMRALIPEFERSSGHKVTIAYGTVGAVADRVVKGEDADVVVTAALQIENLQKQSKVAGGSRADLGKVGIGAFSRKGAPKVDISTVDAFKSALLAAKSIGYVDPAAGAPVGIFMPSLLERLGIATELKPKLTLFKVQERFEHVAKGEVEIGFALTSEILEELGVQLVGPLPATVQRNTLYVAGIVAGSKQQDAAKMLITFLSSPAAATVMKAKGFETP